MSARRILVGLVGANTMKSLSPALHEDAFAADEAAVELVLVKIARLAADIPELRELDVNPLLADKGSLRRTHASPLRPSHRCSKGGGHPRFAVRAYPKEWEGRLTLVDGTEAVVRPVRPEDEPMFRKFFDLVTMDDLRLRFFAPVKEFSHAFIARLNSFSASRSTRAMPIFAWLRCG
jgi:acetyltransferase